MQQSTNTSSKNILTAAAIEVMDYNSLRAYVKEHEIKIKRNATKDDYRNALMELTQAEAETVNQEQAAKDAAPSIDKSSETTLTPNADEIPKESVAPVVRPTVDGTVPVKSLVLGDTFTFPKAAKVYTVIEKNEDTGEVKVKNNIGTSWWMRKEGDLNREVLKQIVEVVEA